VTYFLKARIVEPEETAFARELHSKHVSTVTNIHAIINSGNGVYYAVRAEAI
jgi:hypothetical protein